MMVNKQIIAGILVTLGIFGFGFGAGYNMCWNVTHNNNLTINSSIGRYVTQNLSILDDYDLDAGTDYIFHSNNDTINNAGEHKND